MFLSISSLLLATLSSLEVPHASQNPVFIETNVQTPTYLYKVLSLQDWENTQTTVYLSSFDNAFIHFSTEEQLDKIIEKYWSQVPEFVILKIETSDLVGNLVFETNPGGTTQYYHLYDGSIPTEAIVDAAIVSR